MITHNRPAYTKKSLKRLLETCDDSMRIWVWHNGEDRETLDIIHSNMNHPCFYKFFHSKENKKLVEPTNWLYKNATGTYLGKVDDDCLVPHGWGRILKQSHQDEPRLGVIGLWPFLKDDFCEQIARKKINQIGGNHLVLRNCWVGGSGYVMKKQCVSENGCLLENQSFPNYCILLARKGWIVGWYYPLLLQDHMDDPRSSHTMLCSDNDLGKYLPLTAKTFNIKTISEWVSFIKNDAHYLQSAPLNPFYYSRLGKLFTRTLRTIEIKIRKMKIRTIG